MKKWLLVLSVALPLISGCIPVIFLAGAAVGGVAVYDNRGFKTIEQDNAIAYKAHNRISADPALSKQAHIVVTSFNRILLLVGEAPTPALKQQAYNLVSDIPNVKRIYNQITIDTPTPMSVRSHDTWLTTKVKTQLLTETGLRTARNIKVLTENSVVYLLGNVTRQQGRLAAQTASRVPGVEKVVTLFEYQA